MNAKALFSYTLMRLNRTPRLHCSETEMTQSDPKTERPVMRKPGYLPVVEASAIGLVAGGSALILNRGVHWLTTIRVATSDGRLHLELLPIFGLIGGLIAGLLVLMAPEAAGSGIPQVRAVLDRMKVTLGLKTAIVKLLAGTVALGSGLFMGKEGPTVQVGAAIAAELSRRLPTTMEHRRRLIAAGAGAGLAAAFSAPIAGVVFVLEELLKEINPPTIALAIVACFSASLMQHFFGHPPKAGLGEGIAHMRIHLQDIPFLILLGLLCGFFGAIFNAGVLFFLKIARVVKIPMPAKVAFAGLVTGLLVACLPAELHDYESARMMINTGAIAPHMVAVSFVCFFFLTLLAYGSGAPGGLFAPALALGSALGYMVGYSEQFALGNASIEMFSLVGMGAFFSGAMRVPLTAIVIVFEMASNFTIVTPLMISCVIASTFGEMLYKGPLYDLLMVWSGINLRSPDAPVLPTKHLAARDLMIVQVPTLSAHMTCKEAMNSLRGTDTNSLAGTDASSLAGTEMKSLPVVENGSLVGVALTDDLANSVECENKTVADVMSKHPVSLNPADDIEEVLLLFARYKFLWLAVTDNDRFLGIIVRADLIHSTFGA